MKSFKGYLFILGAALFWGVSATVAKFLFKQNISTLILVQTRMTFSCIVLVVILLIFRKSLLKVKAKDLYKFALLGIVGAAGSNFTYYFTINITNVATAILLQYLAPLLVLLYAAITREEKLSVSKISAGIISLAGCYLAVLGKNFSLLSINHLGLLTGLASAVCWGFTNVMLRHILREYKVWTTLVYSFIFASLFWVFINPTWALFYQIDSSSAWWTFLGFAMISILIPHSFYYTGIQYLTASRAIITATSEPIVAIVSAYIILGEFLTPIQIIGSILVVGAILILQLQQEEEQQIVYEESKL
jgi:drug/metabolite transporter (DMT)-like permease